jgi:hypothetical protein
MYVTNLEQCVGRKLIGWHTDSIEQQKSRQDGAVEGDEVTLEFDDGSQIDIYIHPEHGLCVESD